MIRHRSVRVYDAVSQHYVLHTHTNQVYKTPPRCHGSGPR